MDLRYWFFDPVPFREACCAMVKRSIQTFKGHMAIRLSYNILAMYWLNYRHNLSDGLCVYTSIFASVFDLILDSRSSNSTSIFQFSDSAST